MKIKANIRTQLVVHFFVVVLVAIVVFEIAMMSFIRYFYYSSVEGILKNEITLSADLFQSYLSDSLNDVILQDYDLFYQRTNAQVQLLDNTGLVLMDSIGSDELGKKIEKEDVVQAQSGNSGKYIGKSSKYNHKIMSISYPLRNKHQQIGIIRMIVSLEKIDQIILDLNYKFGVFGILVSLLALVLSGLLSRSIIQPLRRLTKVASKIAQGNFNIKVQVDRNDEIGDLARTMNFMTESIQNKEQIKNDFISSISHELRTPLTSIKGWAITLQGEDTENNEMMKDGLDIIEKESDRLADMVEELLDFSRFVSGRITLQKEVVNLVTMAKSLHRQFAIRAKNENINLVLNYENELILVWADSNRIKQVLINLVDNAIKFTPEEGTVLINIFETDTDIVMEVIDTGIGIGNQEIQLVTERFYKGTNSKSHTGLGLSISEEIVKLHGGEITITSEVDKGTSIKVSLPKGVNDYDKMES